MSRRRALAAVAAGVLAIALGYRWLRSDPGALEYRRATVERGPMEVVVTATGTVNPLAMVQVGTYVSGTINEILVDFNSPVRTGQLVARIDPRPFVVKVRQAEANLANARARVEKASADLGYKRLALERAQALYRRQLVARDAVDTAENDAAQARAQLALEEAQVAQARAALEEAQVNLGYTDIISPVDGVVVARNVDVGQTVAATFQTPTLFLIAEDLTKMRVEAAVSESDIGSAREGQEARFTVDAYPEESFRGRVVQVRNAPVTVQNVVTYDVVIDVTNPELRLRPGMTANVAIVVEARDGVLKVPAAALRFRPPVSETSAEDAALAAATPRVYMPERGRLRAVPVRPGVTDGRYVEIVAPALAEGDTVVVGLRTPAEVSGGAAVTVPRFAPAGGGRR